MIDLVLFSFTSLIVHTATTIQFDGAYRFPSDPGVSTSLLCPLAACAACIIVQDATTHNNTSDDNHPEESRKKRIKIGGKRIPHSVDLTSGIVEYEGLLLGLEGLSDEDCSIMAGASVSVTVQGDCKTVLQQMSSCARPRKLSYYHERSKQILQDKLPDCPIQFEHIPRIQNWLCDHVSAIIIEAQQQSNIHETVHEFECLVDCILQTKQNVDDADMNVWDSLVEPFLIRNFGPEKSHIPYSKRPQFYRPLAKIAFSIQDYNVLLHIGEWFQREVKTVYPGSSVKAARSKHHLLTVEAITYQILALDLLGKNKDCTFLQRKNRFLLQTYKVESHTIQQELLSSCSTTIAPMQLEQPCDSDDKRWSSWLVKQWYCEALQSQSWHQDGVFWGSWMNLPDNEPIFSSVLNK
jgi:hypothetical protein